MIRRIRRIRWLGKQNTPMPQTAEDGKRVSGQASFQHRMRASSRTDGVILRARNRARRIPQDMSCLDSYLEQPEEEHCDEMPTRSKEHGPFPAQTEQFSGNRRGGTATFPFDRDRWILWSHDSPGQVRSKILGIIKICETHDIGSKASIRRIRMKVERWSLDKQRDVHALIPDYERLLDLVEEYRRSQGHM